MPRPTSATTLARPDLQALVMEYMENQAEFIGLKALPIFNVEEQAAEYPIIPVEALLSVPDTRRAPKAAYARDDFEFENDNYACVENGFEEPVDDVEEKLYARYFDVEEIAAMRAMRIVLRVQEKRIADMLFNASNFSATSVTHEWDDPTNAVPITNVKAGRKAIHDACGLDPNVLIISHSTFLDLGLNAQIVDRIAYTNPKIERGDIPVSLLTKVFEVEQVLIGTGMYNTASKGQDASLSQLWDKEFAMLAVVNSDRDLKKPCIGRTFRWVKDSPENVMVESYREEQIRCDVVRSRQHTDEEVMLTACAYLMDNISA